MGEGIRARRRQDNILNEWAIYNLAYAIDESAGGTSGSFTLRSTYYKRAASAYTVSAGGTVSLTGSTQKTVANLAVGDYIVDVSTSSNTSTTGTTLYKITSKSGTTTVTIGYEAYTPSLIAKGTDTGNRVTSKTNDYPIDGIQGDYWYVQIAGSYTMYVWNVYNAAVQYTEKTQTGYTVKNLTTSTKIYAAYSSYGGAEYTFDSTTGIFTLKADLTTEYTGVSAFTGDGHGTSKSWMVGTTSGTEMYVGYSTTSSTSLGGVTRHYSQFSGSRQDATGYTVESVDINAYPQDYYQDGYWYTYSHSYKKRI